MLLKDSYVPLWTTPIAQFPLDHRNQAAPMSESVSVGSLEGSASLSTGLLTEVEWNRNQFSLICAIVNCSTSATRRQASKAGEFLKIKNVLAFFRAFLRGKFQSDALYSSVKPIQRTPLKNLKAVRKINFRSTIICQYCTA